jgi:hypothetical protein
VVAGTGLGVHVSVGAPLVGAGGLRWSRRRIVACLAALAATAVLVSAAVRLSTSAATAPAARGTRSHAGSPARAARAGAAAPALGVYVGPGGLAKAATVDGELGDKVTYAMDFVSGRSWATISDPTWLTSAWRGSPFHLVIGVPMLPASGATLGEGATGAYDPEFAALAARLVLDGLGHSVLMIGWQPDDAGQPWHVGTVAAAHAYIAYWDAIRTTMASIAGAHFLFEWDAGDGLASPLNPASMYPGDAAVDIVATDAFDTVPRGVEAPTRWRFVLERRFGPAWMATFAAEHHKPMAIAMWGLVPTGAEGGGDDPAFVSGMLAWARAAHVEMCLLWDYGSWAVTGGAYPRSLAELEKLAGGAGS